MHFVGPGAPGLRSLRVLGGGHQLGVWRAAHAAGGQGSREPAGPAFQPGGGCRPLDPSESTTPGGPAAPDPAGDQPAQKACGVPPVTAP